MQAERDLCVQALQHITKREAGVAGTQSGSEGPEEHAVGHREAATGKMQVL